MSTQTSNLQLTQPQMSDPVNQTIPALSNNFAAIDAEFGLSGPSTNRPNTNLYVGRRYFDTSVGKPVFWNGATWVDAQGRTPVATMSAPPTTGTWNTGDIVYNSAPVKGGNIGWVCVQGGTPGTWAEFGLISTI
jgi:hypothetical protein